MHTLQSTGSIRGRVMRLLASHTASLAMLTCRVCTINQALVRFFQSFRARPCCFCFQTFKIHYSFVATFYPYFTLYLPGDGTVEGGAELRQQLAEHMATVHLSVNDASERYRDVERRFNYTTPKSFLELIFFYKELLGKKKSALQKQLSRLEKGIETLAATQADVADLKEDLTKSLVRVDEKKEIASGECSFFSVSVLFLFFSVIFPFISRCALH
jgi:hypothetical protein